MIEVSFHTFRNISSGCLLHLNLIPAEILGDGSHWASTCSTYTVGDVVNIPPGFGCWDCHDDTSIVVINVGAGGKES